MADELQQLKIKDDLEEEMEWGEDWCLMSSPAFLFHLPEHDRLCLIHKASAPISMRSFCCGIFTHPGSWLLLWWAELHTEPSFLLQVALCKNQAWKESVTFITPPVSNQLITEVLKALLALIFCHIWYAAQSLLYPSTGVIYASSRIRLTLVWDLCEF